MSALIDFAVICQIGIDHENSSERMVISTEGFNKLPLKRTLEDADRTCDTIIKEVCQQGTEEIWRNATVYYIKNTGGIVLFEKSIPTRVSSTGKDTHDRYTRDRQIISFPSRINIKDTIMRILSETSSSIVRVQTGGHYAKLDKSVDVTDRAAITYIDKYTDEHKICILHNDIESVDTACIQMGLASKPGFSLILLIIGSVGGRAMSEESDKIALTKLGFQAGTPDFISISDSHIRYSDDILSKIVGLSADICHALKKAMAFIYKGLSGKFGETEKKNYQSHAEVMAIMITAAEALELIYGDTDNRKDAAFSFEIIFLATVYTYFYNPSSHQENTSRIEDIARIAVCDIVDFWCIRQSIERPIPNVMAHVQFVLKKSSSPLIRASVIDNIFILIRSIIFSATYDMPFATEKERLEQNIA